MKYLELEKRMTSERVAKENAWNLQKQDLVERQVSALRSEFETKHGEVASRAEEADRRHEERRKALEEGHDKRRRELEAAVAQERDTVRAYLDRRSKELEEAYREKFSEFEREKSRSGAWLQQKEEELLEQHQKHEADLRKGWELKQLELTRAFEDKTRKLVEERDALQKDYERRLREIDLRGKDRPHTND